MNPIIILIIVLVIVLVLYGVTLHIKNKQAKSIAALDEQKIAIFDIPVDSVILKLQNMHLTGKTKRLYESWQERWESLVKETLPNIEAELDKAEQFADQMRFVKSNKAIESARELVDGAEKSAFQIDEALQRIVDSESDNHNEIEAISKQYKDLRNTILTDAESYKEAFPTLEGKLNDIQTSIEQFNTLMEEADYIEARDVLKEVERNTLSLEGKIARIPDLYTQLDLEFVEQVQDLKDGHARMVSEQYQFRDIDIEKAIASLEEEITSARSSLNDLDLDLVDEKRDAISKEIDRLYGVMETEIEAKDYIMKHQSRLDNNLKQITNSNRYVLVEIDRISQNYDLTDGELETAQGYKAELEKEREAFDHYVSLLEDKKAVYSVVKGHFEGLVEKLLQIDSEQSEMMKALSGLRQRERDVREQLEMFEMDLRNMKRTLEKQYLPGLSKAYLDLFFATTKRIETLSEKLNRIKINMKEIDEYVALCVEDIEQLDDSTEAIVDNALLTEQLIQYANRYRMEYVAIEKAIKTAVNLYQYQYKYADARSVISVALDKVENGASKRVETLYREDKKRRVY